MSSKPTLHPIKSTTPTILPPEKMAPEEMRAAIEAQIKNLQDKGVLPSRVVVGERPRVEKVTAEVVMSRAVAGQIFPALQFSEGETHVTLTEILRPAKGNEPIALVHGASGQKFVVDHYELDGVTL